MKAESEQKEKLKTIFLTFFKIGLFTFGGGYAMIPMIEYEIVERHHWIKSEDILDIFAIAGAAPGVVSVNTATFVGYRIAGFWGAVAATLGMTIPSYVIICTIAIFFQQFKSMAWVSDALSGIRAGVIVLVLGAVVSMGKKGEYTPLTIAMLSISFLLATFTDLNIIFILLGGAVIGIVAQLMLSRDFSSGKNKKGGDKE